MKNKKFDLNWQSVLLGMALCAVLVFFIGSKPADAQVGAQQRYQQQRAVNMNDLWEKTNVLEANTVALNERLIRIEEKIDLLQRGMNTTLKTLDKMWNRR